MKRCYCVNTKRGIDLHSLVAVLVGLKGFFIRINWLPLNIFVVKTSLGSIQIIQTYRPAEIVIISFKGGRKQANLYLTEMEETNFVSSHKFRLKNYAIQCCNCGWCFVDCNCAKMNYKDVLGLGAFEQLFLNYECGQIIT